jgi:hypothetical protein
LTSAAQGVGEHQDVARAWPAGLGLGGVVVRRQLIDLGDVLGAMGAEHREQVILGKVRVGCREELGKRGGVAGQFRDRGFAAGGALRHAGVAVMLHRAPVPGQQLEQLVDRGCVDEARLLAMVVALLTTCSLATAAWRIAGQVRLRVIANQKNAATGHARPGGSSVPQDCALSALPWVSAAKLARAGTQRGEEQQNRVLIFMAVASSEKIELQNDLKNAFLCRN